MREIREHKNISAKDFAIDMLGPPQYDLPFIKSKTRFFDDGNRVTFFSSVEDLQRYLASDEYQIDIPGVVSCENKTALITLKVSMAVMLRVNGWLKN